MTQMNNEMATVITLHFVDRPLKGLHLLAFELMSMNTKLSVVKGRAVENRGLQRRFLTFIRLTHKKFNFFAPKIDYRILGPWGSILIRPPKGVLNEKVL